MADSDFNFDYPPTRTLTLAPALEEYTATAEQDSEDVDTAMASSIADGLRWAVEQWGEEATFELEAFTAGTRAQVVDRLNQTRVGEVGNALRRNWFIAAAITEAPWFEGDTPTLEARVEAVAALPPPLADWLETELGELNDLGNR